MCFPAPVYQQTNIPSLFLKTIIAQAPLSYETPPFPSLYWPFPIGGTQTYYLYNAHDIFRFTLLWTIIAITGTHLVAACYAVMMQWRTSKVIWFVPIIYCLIGGIESVIAGSITGALYDSQCFKFAFTADENYRLAAVITAGTYRISTWITFVWGVTNALTLILSSFAIQGGM